MPEHASAPVAARSFWSGTITFGLVSIPVDFYAAARARQKSLKMVDAEGHPLGRQYRAGEEGKPLAPDDIVRGFETGEGKMVLVTDDELESAAPETSRDIDLNRFVPLEQIPSAYFVRPYFLTPGGRSGKAYALLAQTMERAGLVGIGRLVMRGHEYLVAILAEGGTLRAETLRYFDELRTPQAIGLPDPVTPPKKLVKEFAAEIDRLHEKRLDLHELEDREAEQLHELAERKLRSGKDVVASMAQAEEEDVQPEGAEIVDLVALLRRSLGGQAGAPAPSPAAAAPRQASSASADALEDKSREELYRMATELDIPGRSKMKKAELVRVLEQASRAAA